MWKTDFLIMRLRLLLMSWFDILLLRDKSKKFGFVSNKDSDFQIRWLWRLSKSRGWSESSLNTAKIDCFVAQQLITYSTCIYMLFRKCYALLALLLFLTRPVVSMATSEVSLGCCRTGALHMGQLFLWCSHSIRQLEWKTWWHGHIASFCFTWNSSKHTGQTSFGSFFFLLVEYCILWYPSSLLASLFNFHM